MHISALLFYLYWHGLAIDCLIVGIETQADHLSSKKTWTRKIILVTDGENPIEIEDWDATVKKLNDLDITLTIVCVLRNYNCNYAHHPA